MGLDSVELIINFEKYFGIEIPDKEAEEIRTVQQMIDCVAKHLDISNQDTTLKRELFETLKSILIQMGFADSSFALSDYIFNYLHAEDKNLLAKVSQQLELKIPTPYIGSDGFFRRAFSAIWQPQYDWKKVTVEQFITAVCARNYEKLIPQKAIKNTFEIKIAIIAITHNSLGVDVYEVQPDKAFVEDFGID